MKKKVSKKFLILSISSAFTLITGIILACADFGYEDFYNSFFAPETSHAKDYKPFFRSMNKYYGFDPYQPIITNFDSVNVVEWRNFFGNVVNRADMKFLVYKSRIGEIDSLIFYLKDNKFAAKSYLRYNTIYSAADKSAIKEFLYYLGFAKRCEPFATYTPDWWDDNAKTNDPRNSTTSMLKLIEGGSKALANAKSDFIRQRYIFQITRLYYNSEEYKNCITYYNAHADEFKTENTMKYRAMGYAAAAYYKEKRYSEANYLYAKVYDNCKELKISSFQSFHPQGEADWNEALQLAKTVREKATLWHLLGIYADPLRAMKEIYAIDPKSDLLDLLLVRAVNIAEENFLPGQYFYSETRDSSFALKTKQVDAELTGFLKQVADKGNSNTPYLWDLAAGYLCTSVADYKLADKYLKNAEKEAKNDALVTEQIRILRLVSKIEQYKSSSDKTESELTKELVWLNKDKHEKDLRSGYVYSWALRRLSEKYKVFGDQVKAQCLNYEQDKHFYDNDEKINALIKFIDKPNKSDFEQFISTVHPYNRSDLFEYKAIKLIYQYKFREALEIFDECKGSGDGALLADPFIIHINDCHDCDHQSKTGDSYTKYTFVQHLAELKDLATSNPKKLAESYFLLANGLYNMTYFGNARALYETKINEYPSSYLEYENSGKNGDDAITNCSEAKKYYQKAMDLSVDKEFKAECCFMAAKCEQNEYFMSTEFDGNKAIRSGKYYNLLQEIYSKTDYYKEVLTECSYFKTFQKKWLFTHAK